MSTLKRKFTFKSEVKKRREDAQASIEANANQSGPIPRIAKLVALANRMQSMLDSDQVESYQQLAEMGRISQPRMTQIMNLLLLAPDIQEELLHLPGIIQGKATIHEKLLRPMTMQIDWGVQRKMWRSIKTHQIHP